MDKEQLKQFLPHREPMLLIDSAQLLPDGTVTARSRIDGGEWFLQGHFPGQPIVPGVILCEMLAQACGMLLSDRLCGSIPLFAGIEKVKFKRQVVPGDTLSIQCSLLKHRHPYYKACAHGSIDGSVCVSGEFAFMLMPMQAGGADCAE